MKEELIKIHKMYRELLNDVISIEKGSIFLKTEAFRKYFDEFSIESRNCKMYPYRAEVYYEGIRFFTIFSKLSELDKETENE